MDGSQRELAMKKCTGNDTREWGFGAIFEVRCRRCDAQVEFFKDDITRNCPECGDPVTNDRRDFGCARWCSEDSPYPRNICPKFKRSKDRFYGGI